MPEEQRKDTSAEDQATEEELVEDLEAPASAQEDVAGGMYCRGNETCAGQGQTGGGVVCGLSDI